MSTWDCMCSWASLAISAGDSVGGTSSVAFLGTTESIWLMLGKAEVANLKSYLIIQIRKIQSRIQEEFLM
uniref:Secreted protein n=1 Tax=Steinernema glaseri TaxID=37863 RepID=A0A1I7ZUF7_9BILA